jgi:sec-independent protein translocase protein TatB
MFETGFMEMVVVAVIGLLVLGPERLPKVAAEIGKWIGRARRTATQLRRQLEREVELSELEKPATPPPPPSARAAPSSGEVPPGPGTHSDQPAASAPASDLGAPETPEANSIGGAAGSPEPSAANDKPQH